MTVRSSMSPSSSRCRSHSVDLPAVHLRLEHERVVTAVRAGDLPDIVEVLEHPRDATQESPP